MTTARYLRACCALGLALAGLALLSSARAYAPANAPFARTWARTDQPVAGFVVSRTWMWGPQALTGLKVEEYAEGLHGQRTVQYFDKARMELTDPTAIDDGLWYVTNGLLVRELVSGMVQRGHTDFTFRGPAQVAVAGDLDDESSPTYATIGLVLDAPPAVNGALLTARLARDGTVTNDPGLATYGVTAAQRVTLPGIDHQVASPFWAFMNAEGVIYEDDAFRIGRLFPNPYYATGYPISEAYWATVRVAGTAQDVLLQCFERRCLTWTPGNAPGWQVEAGNVGLHYYIWRYGGPPKPPGAARELAFVSERDGNAEIYLVGDDATGLRNLTNHPARDYAVAWSPDGARIAFVSDRSGVSDIWVMDADGGNPRNLTPGAGDEYAPAWSPDGRSIAFVSVRDGNAEIYVMDADGSNQRNLTTHPAGDFGPVWAPDSTRIAFTSARTDSEERFAGVFTVGIAGGVAQQLPTCRELNSALAWSPDGTRIAFFSSTYVGGNPGICITMADGSGFTDLFGGAQVVASGPTWSPDGARIAGIWLQQDPITGEEHSELFVTSVDGSDALAIAADGLGGTQRDRQPTWSADGGSIAWVSARFGSLDIWVTDPDGAVRYALTDSLAFDGAPVWRPGAADADERVVRHGRERGGDVPSHRSAAPTRWAWSEPVRHKCAARTENAC